MGTSLVTEIISILTSGITGMATAIGSGLQDLVASIFLQTTGEGASATTSLSTFGTVIVVFAGISLAISLSRLIVHWISTMGSARVG